MLRIIIACSNLSQDGLYRDAKCKPYKLALYGGGGIRLVFCGYSVNVERFTGLNFHTFHGSQEYRKSFSMNNHLPEHYTMMPALFKHKAPQKFSDENYFIELNLRKFSLANLSTFMVAHS